MVPHSLVAVLSAQIPVQFRIITLQTIWVAQGQ